MYVTKRIIPVIFALLAIGQIHAQEVKVRNVTFKQEGELIIIHYDLDGSLNKKYKVNILLSDDYGATFNIKPKAVKGDVGKNISPGKAKEIVWEMTKDFPDGLEGEGFVFAVDAKLQKGGGKFFYYLLGGGVVGGVVYFVSKNVGGGKSAPTKGSISIIIPGDIN